MICNATTVSDLITCDTCCYHLGSVLVANFVASGYMCGGAMEEVLKKRNVSGECSKSKRTRVKELVGVKRVTASALAFIIASIAPATALTRRGIEYHMDSVWNEVAAPPITLPLRSGLEYTWELCCLSKSINWFARECAVYKHVLRGPGDVMATT